MKKDSLDVLYETMEGKEYYLSLYEHACSLFREGDLKQAETEAMMSLEAIGVPEKGSYTEASVTAAKCMKLLADIHRQESLKPGLSGRLKRKTNLSKATSYYNYSCNMFDGMAEKLELPDLLSYYDSIAAFAEFCKETGDDGKAFRLYRIAYQALRDSGHFEEGIKETGPRAVELLEILASHALEEADYAFAANMIGQAKDVTLLLAKAGPESYEDKLREYDERLKELIEKGNLKVIDNPSAKR
ncbi:MAG: hypothetical protein K5985_01335 [Lachnospiraceae bacterium]|nr:hypothetical protein [Lachnospiraceae bacterium]